MPELVLILAGYTLLTVSILQAGRAILQRLAPEQTNLPLAWMLGSAAFSLGVLLLAVLHILNRPTLALLCLIAIATNGRSRLPKWHTPAITLPATITAIFLAVHFVTALAPHDDSDGYRYHLGFPHLYLNAGGLIAIPEDFYAAFPQAIEMLYTAALAFGGFATANLLHWNFLVALVWSVHASAKKSDTAAAAIAAAPLTGLTVAAAGIDYAQAAAFWMCFHYALAWRHNQQQRNLLLIAAAMAGYCCGIKYTGVVAVPMLLTMLIGGPALTRSTAVKALAAAALPIAPWLIRNALFYRNPVHPFLSGAFPNPHLLPSSEAAWIQTVRTYEGVTFNAAYYWEATMRGVQTMGFAGPYFLLAPIALLALRHAYGRWILTAGLFAALPWIFGNPVLRFAIPAMTFLAIAIAHSLPRAALPIVLIVQAAMCFPPFIERWNKQFHVAFKEIPWQRAFRLNGATPEAWWAENLPAYKALRYLDTHTPKDAKVLALDAQDQLFTTRLLANPYASEHSSLPIEMLTRAHNAHELPNIRCTQSLNANARYLRLLQNDPNEAPWVIHELTIPKGATLTADPNPWDTAFLTDNNDVTAWSSKQPRSTTMYIQAEWRTPVTIQDVTLQTSGYHQGKVTLVVSNDGQQWTNPKPIERCHTVQVPDFQARTRQAIRKMGWTHILTTKTDYPFLDLPTIYKDPKASLKQLPLSPVF